MTSSLYLPGTLFHYPSAGLLAVSGYINILYNYSTRPYSYSRVVVAYDILMSDGQVVFEVSVNSPFSRDEWIATAPLHSSSTLRRNA